MGQSRHLAPGADRHRAPGPAADAVRVTVIGNIPVGPDGRESELVVGQPFTHKHTVGPA